MQEEKCGKPTNNLKVINNHLPPGEKKKDFIVCLKPFEFTYDDVSLRLVEWFEMIKLLGADQVWSYNFTNHENVAKVAEYYKRF